MKLKNGLFVTEIGGKYVLVDTGAEGTRFNGMIKLNATAKRITELLQEDTDLDTITDSLCRQYDVSREAAYADAEKAVNSLRSVNLIVD